MGEEIELAIMDTAGEDILQPLLDQFTAQSGIAVRLHVMTWDTAWSELMRVALYSDGPDVSEIGSTWLGDLVGMNALQRFSDEELEVVGPPAAFLPAAWEATRLAGQPETWAIPWLVGARLLFYRRSLLERAGMPTPATFQTAEQLDQTLQRLQAAGVRVPWTVPTGTTHTTLLNAASWIWGAGGDFLTPDGKRTLFNQPRARAGLRAYFALGRYLTSAVRHLRGDQPDEQFLRDGETGLTISGPWLYLAAEAQEPPVLAPDLEVTLPPGPSFVGGSHLIVWKHSHKRAAALELIRFLTQTEAQVTYSRQVGLLPVRQEALEAEPFSTDPCWQTAIRGVQTGRSLPVTRKWGQVEYRLAATFSTLWAETLANPNLDLDALLAKHLDALALRLDPMLKQP
jgi:multiple sugar transport system substrate-binding protein